MINLKVVKVGEMRKLQFVYGLLLASISSCIAHGGYDPVSTTRKSVFGTSEKTTPIHKALLTQRGYIQFLRWEIPVPEIEEFTFCLWVKSTNLTYSHSIFSYSKDERERFVRSWISPFGRSVHLEIGGIELLAHPTFIKEHRWYHICQSWENERGHYALWIDGQIEAEGYSKQLTRHVIPSDGDIVLGQEYTDFDKGLEEGIEGAVLGFNLLLASAFDPSSYRYPQIYKTSRFSNENVVPSAVEVRRTQIAPEFQFEARNDAGVQLRRNSDEPVALVNIKSGTGVHLGTYPVKRGVPNTNGESSTFVGQGVRHGNLSPVSQRIRSDFADFQASLNPSGRIHDTKNPAEIPNTRDLGSVRNYDIVKDVPDPLVGSASLFSPQTDPLYPAGKPKVNVFLKYPPKIVNDKREGLFGSTLREYLTRQESIDRNLRKRENSHKRKRDLTSLLNDEGVIEEHKRYKRVKRQQKPLGLQLVELTYSHCEIGRGSPFIGGKKMLISWTRTPVRVFGGAIMKNAKSDCGNF